LSEGEDVGQVRAQCSALVARAQGGDMEAFDELYRLHRDKVYSLCLNLCGDRERAQDLLQETFVRGWRGLQGFRGQSAFSTWLHRVAVNVCRDGERRRRTQVGEAHAGIEQDSVGAPEARASARRRGAGARAVSHDRGGCILPLPGVRGCRDAARGGEDVSVAGNAAS